MASTFNCAIEMEPKTLNPLQINHAKELAVGIFQKMEPQEASDLFIQGVRKVGPLDEMEQIIEENDSNMANKCIKDESNGNMESSHNCLCNSLLIESPDLDALQREPATAPF